MSSFGNRLVRAMKLDSSLYEEVEADRTAGGQAAAVVIMASIAGGIGAEGLAGIQGIFFVSLGALGGWLIWAFTTYIVGTRLLAEPGTRSSPGELLRTLGFAHSPGLLNIFGVIPLLGGLVRLAVAVWLLIAWVVAVRQALDYTSTMRAVGVCVVGWILNMLLLAVVFGLLGGMGRLLGA